MSEHTDQLDPNSIAHTEQARSALSDQARSAAGDDVLSSLADLESRLEGLKQLHAQTSARAVEQRTREQTLAAREAELAEREQRFQVRDTEWQRTAEEVRAQQSRLADLERAIDEQRREVQSVRERLEEDARLAAEREQHCVQRERELATRHEGLAEAEAALRSEQARLAVHESTIAKREQTLADGEAQVRLRRAEFDRVAQQHSQQQAEADRFRAWSQDQSRLLDAREHELRDRSAILDEREAELAQREAALTEREAALSARSDDVDRRAEESTARLDEARRLGEDLAKRETSLLGELERLDGMQATLESQRAALEARRVELEDQFETSRASIEEREAQARELEAELERRKAEIEATTDQIDRERAAVSEQQRTLIEQARSDDGSSAISAGRVEMLQIQIGEANARRAAAEAELIQLRDEIAELRREIEAARQTPDREELDREIAKRDHAILKLREKLQELRAALESRCTQEGPISPNLSAEPSLRTRRGRLALYKSLLQQQARKIVAAQSALQKRHAECEQILQQRAKLAQTAQDLARRERRIESSKARSGALIAMLVLCVSTAILAVLSWQITLRVWPGVYVARAMIEADTHGRAVQPDQLAAWQHFHEELVANPQFIDAAAERLNRRGYPSLGRGPELAAKLRADLYVQAADDGQLTLELRESGVGRTEAVLDTIVTTLKAVSEAGRDQRTEDFGVAIVQAAKASERPVNEQTLMGYAGGMLAGGLLAVGLFGAVVWSRLAGSKRRFEQSQAVEDALSDVDWTAMERSMREAGTGPNGPAAAMRDANKSPAKGRAIRGR